MTRAIFTTTLLTLIVGIIVTFLFTPITKPANPPHQTIDSSLDYNEALQIPWEYTKDYQVEERHDSLFVYSGFKLVGVIPYTHSPLWTIIEKDTH